MANTTFSGSVRSEDNFKLVSKNTTTGLIQDRTKASGLKDTRRYYLEEYFVQLPKLNAVNIIDPDAVILGGGVSNISFLYDEGITAVKENIFSLKKDTPILQNKLGDSAGVFGAALLGKD